MDKVAIECAHSNVSRETFVGAQRTVESKASIRPKKVKRWERWPGRKTLHINRPIQENRLVGTEDWDVDWRH
ncbi:hypothetical protein HMPREF2975_04770 [Actinomyces sp. HMSC065F12]|nr:hypothetical protein HMPREF2975_04770 [Actinomyces sp. HMSC065F12]